MRVALGADHAGFELKRGMAGVLVSHGYEILDLGTDSSGAVDYPDIAEAIATAIRSGQVDRAIAICGSGAGVSVAASKFPGVRAAVCHDCYTARQAVEHDAVNVLCLGSRVIGQELATALAESFLGASFSGDERHLRRLAKINAIESRFTRE